MYLETKQINESEFCVVQNIMNELYPVWNVYVWTKNILSRDFKRRHISYFQILILLNFNKYIPVAVSLFCTSNCKLLHDPGKIPSEYRSIYHVSIYNVFVNDFKYPIVTSASAGVR